MMVSRTKFITRRNTRKRKKSSHKLKTSNSIVVSRGKLKVTNFETSDHEIVNYFGAVPKSSRSEKFVNALRTGVGAFNTAETTERIDYVDRKCENMYRQFSEVMQKTIQEIAEKHDGVYGENGQFREIMDENFGENGSRLINLFDPNREGSPFHQLKTEIVDRLFSLEKDFGLKQKEKEVIEKTSLKGQEFEKYCEDVLSKVARFNGDTLENLTEQVGKITASKKGDFLLELPYSNKKIVIEVKDDKSLTQPKIQKILDESLENREASYAIMIVKRVECLPQSIGCWHEFGNTKLVIALGRVDDESLNDELILIATKWARSRVMIEELKNKQVDAEFLESKIDSIGQEIKQLGKVKTECSNIKKSSENIRDIAETLKDKIENDLISMNMSLQKEDEE